jgi:hypothetical protein
MGTDFTVTQTYSASPERVHAMLTDEKFVTFRAENTGAISSTSSVTAAGDGACTVLSTRVLPANVPSFAVKMIGETLTVTETQTWPALSPSGTATGAVKVEFSAPISFAGTMALAPAGDGTQVTVTGTFKASIPFVGGKVEQLAKETTEKYLGKENRLGETWLSEH